MGGVWGVPGAGGRVIQVVGGVVGRPGRRAHERGLGAVRVSVLRAATLSPSQSSAGKTSGGKGGGKAHREVPL
jgi:hypothetical protein